MAEAAAVEVAVVVAVAVLTITRLVPGILFIVSAALTRKIGAGSCSTSTWPRSSGAKLAAR